MSRTMKASSSSASTSAPVAHNSLPPPSGSAGRSSRIAPHSHIKGLGLTSEGFANVDGAGFVGQTNAREVNTHLIPYNDAENQWNRLVG